MYMLQFMYHAPILLSLCFITANGTKKSTPFDFNFQQSDYQCKPEHVDVVSYDKNFLEYLKIVTFKYNRTCIAFNLSVNYKIDFENKMEVIIQAFKFSSNEYRLFPLRYEINVCTIFKNNILGVSRLIKCGNFTRCPLLENKHYHLCNFSPDMTKLPPFIPTGRYMIEIYGLYLSKEIRVGRAYAEVYRPFV